MSRSRWVVGLLAALVVALSAGMVGAGPVAGAGPLVVTQQSIPDPQYGLPYAETPFTASGGTAPYTWSLVSTPDEELGLSLDPATGELRGTPSSAFCKCRYVVRVTDAAGASVDTELFVYPYHHVPDQSAYFPPGEDRGILLDALPCRGCEGALYAWGPMTALPPGLSLTSSGVLEGTLSEPGVHQFTVVARSYWEGCLGGADCVGDEYERIWVHRDTGVVTVVSDNRSTLDLVAPAVVKYPNYATVTGTLTRITGEPVAGQPIQLQQRPVGTSGWTTISIVATTDSAGQAVFDSYAPAGPVDVRLVFAGAPGVGPRTTGAQRIALKPVVSLVLSAGSVSPGTPITLSGTVTPDRSGRKVVLQRRDGTGWAPITVATLDGESSYSFTQRPATTTTYRVRIAAGGGWEVAASPARTVTVP